MAWTKAPAIQQLANEVNARWPNRSKASDGFIGDAAHAATASDHNPNSEGVVCAFDITHDPANGPDIAQLYEYLRTHPHPNQKYIIANGRIASRKYNWADRPYSGDPHTNHLHASVGVGPDGRSAPGTYNDTSPWLGTLGMPDQPTPPAAPAKDDDEMTGTYVQRENHTEVFLLLSSGEARHVTNYADAEEIFVRQLGVKITDYKATEPIADAAGNVRNVWVVNDAAADMLGLPK